jgi:hypothetical protein
MSWSANLPIARDPGARILFVLSVLGCLAVLVGIQHLATHPTPRGLTSIYLLLFERLDNWGNVCMLLTLIAMVFVPTAGPVRAFLHWLGTHPYRIACATFIALCFGSLLVYQDHPLAMDEYAQLFQSRVFAAGHLAGQFPAPLLDWLIPEGFQNYFLFVSKQTGAVVSTYWPSFALLLTPFTFLGIPWACNPCLSAATLIVVHRLAMRIFDDPETAGLAVLLTLASPVFFANGISFYSMPAHLLANSLFALLLSEPTPRRAFTAGVVGSIGLTLHNPVPHMLFALPWLIWLALRPRGVALLAAAALGYAPLCLILGLGWFWFTTMLRQESLDAAAAASTQLEHIQRLGQGFGRPDSTVLLARLIGVAKIWVWAVPGLLPLAAIGAWKWRDHVLCRLILGSALLTFVGYLFVPLDQGHGWGFRYFHSAWLVLPLLAAGVLKRRPTNTHGAVFESDATRAFIVECCMLTLVFGIGLRAWQIHDFIARDLEQVPAYTGTERRVVILDPTASYYGADLVQNDPWLRTNATRMITRGPQEDEDMMREYFPGLHRVYADQYGSVWSAASAHTPTHRSAAPVDSSK